MLHFMDVASWRVNCDGQPCTDERFAAKHAIPPAIGAFCETMNER
jgi:hypothetical protein